MSAMTCPVQIDTRPLRSNTRGAIMVLGIFFACIMIGWMWMLVGLGDAMIWRDRSQEAADAVTYSSAAIQAKGMNLISFLNAIMLVITFVYLIMAMLYNILDWAHVFLGSQGDGGCWGSDSDDRREEDCDVIAAACDIVPGLEEVGVILGDLCDQWTTVAQAVQKMHSIVGDVLGPYEKDVMAPVLPVLSTLETVAAYGAPWAGEAVGVYMGTKYVDYGKSRYGLPLSATLIPGALTPFTIKWNTDTCETTEDSTGGKCKTIDSTKDGRQGLPVEIPEDGMSKLCYVAAETVFSGISDLLGGFLGELVGWIFDGAADMVEDDWCKKDSQGFMDGADSPVIGTPGIGMQFLTLVQDAGWSNNEKCPNNNWGQNSGGGGAGELGCGGPGTCNGVYQIQTSSDGPLWQNPDKVGGPHLVVEYASNGSDWMQVWSFVYGGNRVEQSERKVAVAGMDSQGPTGGATGTWKSVIPQNSDSILNSGFPMYMAQSEFYYDCTEKWTDDDCNAEYSKSSFEMRWRARLRRVRGLSWKQDLFGYFTEGSLGDNFSSYATKWLSGLGGQPEVASLSSQFAGFITSSALKGAFNDIKNAGFDQLGGMINPANVMPDIIH
jgi:hypothetical protein